MTLDDIEFHALRAIRYHEARGRYLDTCRRVLDFLVILLGAGAVTSQIGDSKPVTAGIGVALAAIGGLQLVAGFGEKAQAHEWLRRRFCEVLAKVVEAKAGGATGLDDVVRLTKRLSGIWADERATMHVLEAVAYNATKRALERNIDERDLIYISWWRNWTRNLFAQEGFKPLTSREVEARGGRVRGGG